MEPKKKVKDILNEVAGNEKLKIKKFVRFKVGEEFKNPNGSR